MNGILGPEEWCLVIQGRTIVGDKGAGDVESAVVDEWGRAAVPRSEGRCRVRLPQATVREGGAVGLAIEDSALGHLGDEGLVPWDASSSPIVVHKAIVLHARSGAEHPTSETQGEEPVGVVDGLEFGRPEEEALFDDALVLIRGRLPRCQRVLEALGHGRAAELAHDVIGEDLGSHGAQGRGQGHSRWRRAGWGGRRLGTLGRWLALGTGGRVALHHGEGDECWLLKTQTTKKIHGVP
mmetsp:Transcript_33214/g.96182  ORF Transcript_33214/g.96182 Transcript_33214/m.96182 type:complete len:238 (-) Transcript_33214:6-719(-)